MRTAVISLCASILLLCACNKKQEDIITVERPVSKTATFQIYAVEDYSKPAYDDATADVRLRVLAIKYATGEQRVLWDSSFGRQNLSSFPREGDKIIITKKFEIMESEEKLNAGFSVMVDQNGYKSAAGNSSELLRGENQILIQGKL